MLEEERLADLQTLQELDLWSVVVPRHSLLLQDRSRVLRGVALLKGVVVVLLEEEVVLKMAAPWEEEDKVVL